MFFCPVTSLPMRNWNRFPRPIQFLSAQRYQPTYEELKLLGSRFRRDGSFSYQPTYEELKPYCILGGSEPVIVTSLPMRNWNLSRAIIFSPSSHVTSLPMRNWNPSPQGSAAGELALPAYLWGIETPSCRGMTLEEVEGYQPTYEELKLN